MPRISNKTNRQIKRNIKSYLDRQRHESSGAALDAVFHILAALVAILLPISLVALASDIVFRVPDLMAFELDRSGILQETGLDLTPDAVADEISEYLRHKKDVLDLTTQIARKDVPVFSFMDEVNLGRIRALLDKALYPAAGALALSVVLFMIVRLADKRRYLRYAMRVSVFLYICTLCFTVALAFFAPLRERVFAWQPGLEFSETDLLPRLFGGLYPILSAGMACLISFIIYITLYSVMIRFTKEKEKIF